MMSSGCRFQTVMSESLHRPHRRRQLRDSSERGTQHRRAEVMYWWGTLRKVKFDLAEIVWLYGVRKAARVQTLAMWAIRCLAR